MSIWEDLGAGSYGALNEVLMGLPDFLVKNVGGKETYQNLKKFRDEHKTASDIGGGLGFIGSMLIPAGGLAKLAGKGAKLLKLGNVASKLDKFGDVARLSSKGMKGLQGFKTAAKAGAAQALEQAVPRALTSLDKEDLPGSLGKAALQLPGALAGGAIGGATLGRLFDKVTPHVVSKVKDANDLASNIMLSSMGPTASREITNAFGGMGRKFQGTRAVKGAEDFKNKVVDYIRKHGLQHEANQGKFFDDVAAKWQQVSKNYDKVMPKYDAGDLLKVPAINDIKDMYAGDFDKVVSLLDKVTGKINRAGSSAEQKKYLSDLVYKAMGAADPDTVLLGDIARAVKDKIDDNILKVSDVGEDVLKELKANYPMEKVISNIIGGGKARTGTVSGGSDTAAKLLAQNLTAPLIGGAAGFAQGGGDISDPEVLQKKLLSGLTGVAAGGMLNKIATTGMRRLVGELGRTVGKRIPIAEVIEKGALRELPGKLAGALPTQMDKAASAETPAAIQQADTPQAQQAIGESMEAETTPEVKEQTKRQFTDQYKGTIVRQLQLVYETYYKDNPQFPGMTFDDFAQRAKQATDGFDPLKSASLLFPDSLEKQAAYMQKYNMMQYLNNLDVESALEKGGGVFGFGDKLGDEQVYNDLRDLMLQSATGGDVTKMSNSSLIKEVERDLDQIIKAKGMRKTLLQSKLKSKYGLDFADLAGMGIV